MIERAYRCYLFNKSLLGFKILVKDELINIELVNRKADELDKYMK